MPQNTMQHIFLENHQSVLAYSPKDKRLTRRLVADLKSEGIIAWTGDYLKTSGDYWLSSMQQALDQANCLLVLLTPDAMQTYSVEQAVAYAREQSIPIFLLLAKGDALTIQFGKFGSASLIDLRPQVQNKEHLVSPELMTAVNQPRPDPPRRYLYWNPLDQFRLFFAMFWHPERVQREQQDRQLTNLKRTGGWLAITMFFLILLCSAIGDMVTEPSLRSFSRIVFISIPGIWIGQFFESITSWDYVLNAILGGVAMILLLLATLLLIDLEQVRLPRLTSITFFITFPLLGGIAGGIAEAFQTHRLIIFFFTLISAFIWGAVAISLAVSTVVSAVGSGAWGIFILFLLGSTVGILAIVIVYLLLFLVADSLIRTLYLNKRSHVSRAVPSVAIGCYVLLLFAATL